MYNLLKIKCINMLKSVAEIEDIMAYVYVVEDDKNISEIESFALKQDIQLLSVQAAKNSISL